MTGEKREKKRNVEKGKKGKEKGNWEEKSNPYYIIVIIYFIFILLLLVNG